MDMQKRHLTPFFLILLVLYLLQQFKEKPAEINTTSVADNQRIHIAFEQKNSDVLVTGSGTIIKILPDDLRGRKHQRFIVKLDKKLSVLIAHNIDIAPRINNLANGDQIIFSGEYEWNNKGGVIHWTHRDPAGNHKNGWLQHKDILYQ